MKKLLRIAVPALMIGGLVYAVVVAWRPAPIAVESARVSCGPLRVTIDAEGRTRVRNRYVVAAPVTGKLRRITLNRGDQVARDAIVAQLEPLPLTPLDPRQHAEAKARVAAAEQLQQEAEAGVTRARTDCEQAQRELTRATHLVESGDLARQEFERIRNAAQTCQSQLSAAQFRARAAAAEIEIARAMLLAVQRTGQGGGNATVSVRAPIGGRVLRVLEESERVVQAGAPLLELSNTVLEIVVDVLSTDAVKIKPGVAVLIEGWGGARALPARVRLIEPSGFTKVSALGIEEQRVNIIADFSEADVPLGDGYRVEARIVYWEAQETVKVPLSALFRREEDWYVFVIEQDLARERRVIIGEHTAFEAEARQGLQEGEEVIVHPSNQVKAGIRIERR
ncbi:MAG TPA: HlyD family efflux transporter periplasmic adaptor subunit [Roseiflexaceae bacterium]|nr:HlyD family efflux transporter periplasmic adaptor subunit [Roseiflexaceae bacterium]